MLVMPTAAHTPTQLQGQASNQNSKTQLNNIVQEAHSVFSDGATAPVAIGIRIYHYVKRIFLTWLNKYYTIQDGSVHARETPPNPLEEKCSLCKDFTCAGSTVSFIAVSVGTGAGDHLHARSRDVQA